MTEISDGHKLCTELNRLGARECVISHRLAAELRETDGFPETRNKILWTELDNDDFDFSRAEEFLKEHFKVATLDGFGCRNLPLAVSAAGGKPAAGREAYPET